MNKGIFITGTDTDIGKTFVTGGITYLLRKNGVNASYFKAALSGAKEREGKLIPGDTEFVCNLSGICEEYSFLTPYVYKEAVSPHLAAQIENRLIDLKVVEEAYLKVSKKYDYVVTEGSGGIVCPIIDKGDEVVLLEDIIRLLRLDTLLVASAGVGTINHTVLTVNYMKSKGINIRGIIINGYDNKNICHRDNVKMIKKLTGKDIIALIPKVRECSREKIREVFDNLDCEKILLALGVVGNDKKYCG